jgi:hypothetical protein
MAYSKVSNKSQDKDVKYLSKDYNSFKNQLIDFAQVYFPDNFNDFSEGNPGMMFLEMAAYVGDVLSFYTDTQLKESFLNLAQDRKNIYNLAYSMGYKPKITSAASANLDISQLIPSDASNNYEPDYDFALSIGKNSTFTSLDGVSFYITKDVRFGYSSSFEPTEVSIYQYDLSNNPEYYLLKKTVPAVSGQTKSQTFTIGAVEKFKTINLFDPDIISIESISDSEGNMWTEVPYLAQDIIFEEVQNLGTNDPTLQHYNNQTPYLLKIKRTSKRLDTAYDPSNFLYTRAYGEAPSNTTLTVRYLVGGGLKSNVNSNTITSPGTLLITNKPNVNSSMINFSKSSITCTNLQPARGGGAGETLEEVRMNTIAHFSTQHRTVTKDDYLIRTLSMPSQFGRVAKAFIMQDDQTSPLTNEPNRIPNPLALNLYTLGYDSDKKLTTLNDATKTNLATYLEQYRMLTDAINIKDAFVINFQVEFEVTTFKNYNNQLVLLQCIAELQNYFSIDKWQINQPIIIAEVQNIIGGVDGVQTIKNLTFNNVSGIANGYSQYKYGFSRATRDGVIFPSMDSSIFELKYPNTDIIGRVTTY